MSTPEASGAPVEKLEEEAPKHINLKVRDQGMNEIMFKIKRTTLLEKLMNAYAQQQGRDINSIRFTLDGVRLQKNDSPESLEMEDGDCIDVFHEQLGGNAFKRIMVDTER